MSSEITINSNIASLQTQRRLGQNTSVLNRVFERLSSGQRINRASDDAAGLAISDSLRADSRVFAQAVRNLNDGISMLNIAGGALSELSEITIRQKELAEEAANGVFSVRQRMAMHTEANALVDEFNRIVQITKFNNTSLLENAPGTNGVTGIQAGYGTANTLSVNTTALLARSIGTGTFNPEASFNTGSGREVLAVDFNRDGNIDLFETSGTFLAGNGDGSFKAAVTCYSASSSFGVADDFNRDGYADILSTTLSTLDVTIALGNGNGTFKSVVTYTAGTSLKRIASGDFNGDGFLDFTGANSGENTFSIVLGNGNGTFKNPISYSTNSVTACWGITAGDVNNDGRTDVIIGDGSSEVSVALGTGLGTFKTPAIYNTGAPAGADDVNLADFNGDGLLDIATANWAVSGSFSILIGNGDGSFKRATSYSAPTYTEKLAIADINGDGILDIASANAFGASAAAGTALGNGDGTFKGTVSFATSFDPYSIKAADLNNDGVPDLITPNLSSGYLSVFLATTTQVTTTPKLYLLSQTSARSSLDLLKTTLERISSQVGMIGAFQSRVGSAISNIQITIENFAAAESQIRDTDVGIEAANLAKGRILQQAATMVLARANLEPQIALTLLRGTG